MCISPPFWGLCHGPLRKTLLTQCLPKWKGSVATGHVLTALSDTRGPVGPCGALGAILGVGGGGGCPRGRSWPGGAVMRFCGEPGLGAPMGRRFPAAREPSWGQVETSQGAFCRRWASKIWRRKNLGEIFWGSFFLLAGGWGRGQGWVPPCALCVAKSLASRSSWRREVPGVPHRRMWMRGWGIVMRGSV